MDKEIVVVVSNEVSAYEVFKALKALDDQGSIELYASTVVMKTPEGRLTVKSSHELRGPWAPMLGMSTGALIGLLAGPAGMAAGAAIGAATGLGAELTYTGFAGDFLYDVAAKLQPGTWAVCASLWEDWTVPVDVAIAAPAATPTGPASRPMSAPVDMPSNGAHAPRNSCESLTVSLPSGVFMTTVDA